ncbi:hypothetical protein VFPBJ_03708 [Purpureocillium lilacinum]|uniref:Uncharacterized protein n=1 Tax=Purpureocillium lilacinum TaxID=33203 RepID=A0A179H688_PURLI|nr:hypothetical protein VFPBJ_03708 [Purpureocillium lilacinum]
MSTGTSAGIRRSLGTACHSTRMPRYAHDDGAALAGRARRGCRAAALWRDNVVGERSEASRSFVRHVTCVSVPRLADSLRVGRRGRRTTVVSSSPERQRPFSCQASSAPATQWFQARAQATGAVLGADWPAGAGEAPWPAARDSADSRRGGIAMGPPNGRSGVDSGADSAGGVVYLGARDRGPDKGILDRMVHHHVLGGRRYQHLTARRT